AFNLIIKMNKPEIKNTEVVLVLNNEYSEFWWKEVLGLTPFERICKQSDEKRISSTIICNEEQKKQVNDFLNRKLEWETFPNVVERKEWNSIQAY
ncbi:MAG: hypothetical protein ABEH43_10470, partial [Flavobacteriales bacterium]